MSAKKIIDEALLRVHLKNGVVCQANVGDVIWNVADTSDEETEERDNNSWTAFWQRLTRCNVPLSCPVCGAKLTAENTKGAHVRFHGEPEDDMAWIVPLCSACNNWQNVPRMILSDKVYFARTKMSKEHNNANY